MKIRFNPRNKLFTGCASSPRVWQQRNEWYQSALGNRLAAEEQVVFDEILPNLFGYHLCQIGTIGDTPTYNASRVAHRFVMDISLEPDQVAQLQGSVLMLPLATDSIDVVLLPHILEFTDNPHAVLREIERVLIGEGHIVLTAFNPLSVWSLWKLLFGWRRQIPWCGRFYTSRRLKDWLALLGFEVEIVHHYFYRPPFKNNTLLKRTRFVETISRKLLRIFGGSYVIVARKRVETLTPIRPRWYNRHVMPGLVKPLTPQKRKSEKQLVPRHDATN